MHTSYTGQSEDLSQCSVELKPCEAGVNYLVTVTGPGSPSESSFRLTSSYRQSCPLLSFLKKYFHYNLNVRLP